MTALDRPLVVVGVDGSTGSRDAVRQADTARVDLEADTRRAGFAVLGRRRQLAGRRRTGRAVYPGMLLGSVAEYCVRNGPLAATC